MKRSAFLVLVSAMAAAACGALVVRSLQPNRPDVASNDLSIPTIRVDSPSMTLGVVRPGSRHVVEYTITNRGQSLLLLGKPLATCDCEEPVLSKAIVKAGESTSLAVAFTPKTNLGAFRESVFLTTNDPFRALQRVR